MKEPIRNKTHTAVSIPLPLFEELRKLADASDRSVAKQIEHYMRIGMTLETAVPSADLDKVKVSKKSFLEVISGLVESGGPSRHFVERMKRENPSRIHFEDDKAYLTKPDGSVLEGRLNEVGDFVYERTVRDKTTHKQDIVQHHSV